MTPADAQQEERDPRSWRRIAVPQKSFYMMWGGLIFIMLFMAVLTVGYFHNPDLSGIHGRNSGKLIVLIYGLPIVWPILIACAAFLWFRSGHFPRMIEVDSGQITIQTRSKGTKTFDAFGTTEIKQDRYNTLYLSTAAKKNALSIALGTLKEPDRQWMTVYIRNLCAYLAQEGRPVKVS